MVDVTPQRAIAGEGVIRRRVARRWGTRLQWRHALVAVGLLGAATSACENDVDTSMRKPRRPSRLSFRRAAQRESPARVTQRPDPAALAELLGAVPHAPAALPTAATLVGSDTGVPGRTEPVLVSPPTPSARIRVGTPTFDPLLSSPALEQTARAQLYWALHKACPGPDGKPLPADVITLRFTIRADGSVEPASVSASSADNHFQQTAECVLKTFSSLPFHGPVAGRGSTATLVVTWPSVD
ncbi:MAG TPA: hypothetical protein ENK23_07680 [Sorangium sp.]|nr:hypothetical protein [Sorangium sp.]